MSLHVSNKQGAPMSDRAFQILAVDDHAMVREGIVRILQAAGRNWTVEQASSGEEALERMRHQRFDVVITDMTMPGISGLGLVNRMHSGWPLTKVLVLSMHAETAFAVRAFQAGASGYLTKERAGSELVEALSEVAAGRNWVTKDVADEVIQRLHQGHAAQGLNRLSNREFDIFRRIVSGQRVVDIAEELHLSVKTVSTHKRRILDKLALDSTAALVRFGVRNGIGADTIPA
jgi:DNA-binding NarL/FixJ family response regulator